MARKKTQESTANPAVATKNPKLDAVITASQAAGNEVIKATCLDIMDTALFTQEAVHGFSAIVASKVALAADIDDTPAPANPKDLLSWSTDRLNARDNINHAVKSVVGSMDLESIRHTVITAIAVFCGIIRIALGPISVGFSNRPKKPAIFQLWDRVRTTHMEEQAYSLAINPLLFPEKYSDEQFGLDLLTALGLLLSFHKTGNSRRFSPNAYDEFQLKALGVKFDKATKSLSIVDSATYRDTLSRAGLLGFSPCIFIDASPEYQAKLDRQIERSEKADKPAKTASKTGSKSGPKTQPDKQAGSYTCPACRVTMDVMIDRDRILPPTIACPWCQTGSMVQYQDPGPIDPDLAKLEKLAESVAESATA
jgi:hypothetical protein